MSDINSTTLRGHLARDPQISQSEKGVIARFTLCCNRPKKANGESAGTDFISVVAYSPEADKLLNAKKGAHVSVTGPIVTGSYDKEGVGKVYTTDVRADVISVYSEAPAQQTSPQSQPQQPQQSQTQPQASPFGNSGFPTPPNQPQQPQQSQTQPQTQPQAPQQNPVDNFANIGSGLPWA